MQGLLDNLLANIYIHICLGMFHSPVKCLIVSTYASLCPSISIIPNHAIWYDLNSIHLPSILMLSFPSFSVIIVVIF